MKNVKLSIIIPVYNNYKQLEKCLVSIFKQSFNDHEIIIIDDGSEHLNTETLRHLNTKFNFNYYKIEHGGAPRARNFGFEKSSGEYVFFCDADVVFLKPDALQKFVDVLYNNSEIDFAYSQFKFGWKKFKCFEFNIEKLKQNNYISANSIIRRSALEKISNNTCLPERHGPWDENLKKFQDWDLWLSLIKKGSSGKLIKEVLWKAKSSGTMSKWLPGEKFNFYKFFPNAKNVQEFEKAKEIIKKKHGV
ncbi:glycosyltransferase family A protein [Patescibacteria group bacterium]